MNEYRLKQLINSLSPSELQHFANDLYLRGKAARLFGQSIQEKQLSAAVHFTNERLTKLRLTLIKVGKPYSPPVKHRKVRVVKNGKVRIIKPAGG